ncbi:MAG: ABC transporter substrate-binding protein [bacterium]
MKKFICALLILLMLAVGLVGCGKQSDTTAADGREKVTIALWGNDLLENYTTYLCKTFPNVEFKFVLATNSIDYYRYLKEHDDLPDIMTVRRFSMRDAAMLKDSLYDLCNTDLAATYYGTYLDSYTYDDGTVNWLPACAEVDSIIINKSLFQEHNIAVPKDYASFIAACKAFEALGIRGFAPDYAEDYTCMETLQGFSISQLNSMEGREWRQQYESGKTDQLSEKVWLPVFEKFFDLKEKAGLGKAETELKNVHPKKKYVAGKQAMYRGTGADVITYTARRNDESLLLPYFGDTERDDWYLTYPVFQVAASKKSMEDPKRRKLILQIMQAMLSQDGQNNISHGKNMIPYNKNVSLELLPRLPQKGRLFDESNATLCVMVVDKNGTVLDVAHFLGAEKLLPREALEGILAGTEDGYGRWGDYDYYRTIRAEIYYIVAASSTVRLHRLLWTKLSGAFMLLLVPALALTLLLCVWLSRFAVRPARDAIQKQQQFLSDAGHRLGGGAGLRQDEGEPAGQPEQHRKGHVVHVRHGHRQHIPEQLLQLPEGHL